MNQQINKHYDKTRQFDFPGYFRLDSQEEDWEYLRDRFFMRRFDQIVHDEDNSNTKNQKKQERKEKKISDDNYYDYVRQDYSNQVNGYRLNG